MSQVFDGIGRLLKVVFGLLALLVLAVSILASLVYYKFAKDLPKIYSVSDYHPPVISEVFADDGTKIGEFWQECRILVPYDQIPKRVIESFVSSEDVRFWDHKGVDFQSILRAFVENLRAGHVVQGGSTITQQITRALLLSREKSLDRKIKEAILATQIEQNLSKEQILYLYLNQIYLGNRSYGVAAAARNYFHKDLKDLNLAEISMIAGLPSAPTDYSPVKSPDLAKQRQLHVLDRLLEHQFITPEEYDEALQTDLKVYRAGLDKDFNHRTAPYFVEHIRRSLEEKYGVEALYHSGLKIMTTANVKASLAAEAAVKKGLLEMERRKGFRGPVAVLKKSEWEGYTEAIHREISEWDEPIWVPGNQSKKNKAEAPVYETVLNPRNIYKGLVTAVDARGRASIRVGRVEGFINPEDRAWTGRIPKLGEIHWVKIKSENTFTLEQKPKIESALFSYNPLTGEVKAVVGGFSFKDSEFNRATQALRQPGSAFKPIIYSAALDKGYTPGTLVVDGPVEYRVGKKESWSPKNYGNKFNGPMTLRSALTNSVNVVAVKVFHDIGIDYGVAYARKMGLTTPIQRYLSSALGASDVSLQELTRAYGVFPSGGVRPDLLYVRKITDGSGKILEENVPNNIDVTKVFDVSERKNRQSSSFNTDLMTEGDQAIKEQKLKITPQEMSILYGSSIPAGHVITPQTAFLMVNLMKDVVDHGTGFKAKALKRPAAGKTGTTNDESDAWFIGYVPNLIAGVWVGYDSRKSIGSRMTGGVVSAPIWLDYMQEILENEPVLDFSAFPGVKNSEIDAMHGGSAPEDFKPSPEESDFPQGQAPASRGVDFLYQDSNGL